MKKALIYLRILSLFTIAILIVSCGPKKREGNPKVLVFSKTEGFRHSSIEDGAKALVKLGKEKGFEVTTSEDASLFTDESLKEYSTIIFLNTTGDILNTHQEIAFERYIQAGGGFVGIHAATDTEYDWKWYGQLVGAYFKSHPKIQEAKLLVHEDPAFPVLKSLPEPWNRKDEWYNFVQTPDHVNVLVSIDESSYEGGSNGHHPMVWYHNYDGGRSFYMEFGHTSSSFEEVEFLDLLYAGISYAIGENTELDYSIVKSDYPPDEDRFSKVILARGLAEPTEIAILPNNNILISERTGGIQYYDQSMKELKKLVDIPVYSKTDTPNVNVETGLMGIQVDPNYDTNHWIYVFYSPVGVSVDRLSRFQFKDDKWDMDSEQVILDVKTDRDICCHTGGSIAFDKEGNLYVSTGDNTTPFNQKDKVTGERYAINLNGFAPLDDRPGKEQYDGRRAPGNTNDLRGKIIRIKVEEDGSYSIPEGNLFAPDNPKARPEIYVMGNRNPYRISVDQKTGFLYWGEVGPDARADSLDTRGPRGHDEVNQARKAGNFGWPYFVGDNKPYWQYDFNIGESQLRFDPEKPVNNSRNNTGLTELPPAQPAFIWYPYNTSKEFPILGSGGRTAMAGPVYYPEFYPAETRMADYYDGKLFIYEWIRNWIKVVTMNEEGDIMRIEPFMPNTKFFSINDIEFAPDGQMYMIEYGSGWFSKNANSSLVRIEYNGGNRAPQPTLAIDRSAGQVPLTIEMKAEGSYDPDGDKISYTWKHNGQTVATTEEPQYTLKIEDAGEHNIYVEVSDIHGSQNASQHYTIVAGNTRPEVAIEIEGNQQYYFANKPLRYSVSVNDAEDGSMDSGIEMANIRVDKDYVESLDKASTTLGHQESIDPELEVLGIISGLDCASCHKKNEKSVGPAYMEISKKYVGQDKAKEHLVDKVIQGGSGVWGEVAMAAHPDLPLDKVSKIVDWILGLSASNLSKPSLPVKGSFHPSREYKFTEDGVLVISASYKDKGGENAAPLSGNQTIYLARPFLSAYDASEIKGGKQDEVDGHQLAIIEGKKASLHFKDIDLTDIRKGKISFAAINDSPAGWHFELRKGSATGEILMEKTIGVGAKSKKPLEISQNLSNTSNENAVSDLWINITDNNDKAVGLALMGIEWMP
ncbi:ThuA domain-containing protein [Membranihabitans marinus]|uniref:ThuA domain-containing protein n=1 Tax=Membranihabitans marinus TaxID=1227546 RepID=UPI001F3EE4F6|nr:ThuA domain-containing protein [Membranihabitans marinus]